jgi:subtilisin family serine protease
MKLIRWSGILLSATLLFAACSKDDQPVPLRATEQVPAAETDNKNVIEGKYIVMYKSDETAIADVSSSATYETRVAALSDHIKNIFFRSGIKERIPDKIFVSGVNGFVSDLTDEEAEKLRKDPSVAYVEHDRVVSLDLPQVSEITAAAQTVPWGVAKVGYATGTGKTAWIIDSGIDPTHPDLVYDAARSKSFLGAGTTPYDQNGHGTHVAGIIAARNDGNGIIGVACGATVVSMRALDAKGSGTVSGIVAAVDWSCQSGRCCQHESWRRNFLHT